MTKFGSNVQPKNFGRGGEIPKDWECICGYLNKGTVRLKKANKVVCWQCGITQELAMEAKETPDLPRGGAQGS